MSTSKVRKRNCYRCCKLKLYKGFRKRVLGNHSVYVCYDCQIDMIPRYGETAFVGNFANAECEAIFLGQYKDILGKYLSPASDLCRYSLLWLIKKRRLVEVLTTECTTSTSSFLLRQTRQLIDKPKFVYGLGGYYFKPGRTQPTFASSSYDFFISGRVSVPGVSNFYFFRTDNSVVIRRLGLWNVSKCRWVSERVLVEFISTVSKIRKYIPRLDNVYDALVKQEINID